MTNIFLVLFLVVAGETLSVYVQVQTAILSESQRRIAQTSPSLFALWALGGFLLIAGYVFGAHAFASVWKITAVSVTSILMVEPALLVYLTDHRPSRFEMLGFLFGALGLLITLLGS